MVPQIRVCFPTLPPLLQRLPPPLLGNRLRRKRTPLLPKPQISTQTTTAGEPEDDAEAWVDGGNVSFAFTVFLTPEETGDALEGYTGKPYSSAASPEEGVLGTGYAMTADEARALLLEISEAPLDPSLEQAEGDALGCIVVQDAAPPAD